MSNSNDADRRRCCFIFALSASVLYLAALHLSRLRSFVAQLLGEAHLIAFSQAIERATGHVAPVKRQLPAVGRLDPAAALPGVEPQG